MKKDRGTKTFWIARGKGKYSGWHMATVSQNAWSDDGLPGGYIELYDWMTPHLRPGQQKRYRLVEVK